MKQRTLLILLGISLFIFSCSSNPQIDSPENVNYINNTDSVGSSAFIIIEDEWSEIQQFKEEVLLEIVEYKSKYNPKSNGYIWLLLEDSTVYEAKQVDGGSFSSAVSLLNDTNVLFDPVRKDIVIQKTIKNDAPKKQPL